jgi:hypothetical protein
MSPRLRRPWLDADLPIEERVDLLLAGTIAASVAACPRVAVERGTVRITVGPNDATEQTVPPTLTE